MQRRHALTLLARSAAVMALGSLFSPSRGGDGSGSAPPRYSNDPFTLGVASGMPRPHSVVLWTRLAPHPHAPLGGLPDQPLRVRWEVAADEGFRRLLARGITLAHPEHAHSVHVEVTGLPSGRPCYYRFISGDAVSPVGRTRTAPAEDADIGRLRLALASCQHYEQGHFAAHREIAARELDAVLFVGDYIYESTNPRLRVRHHEALAPTGLHGYRRRHATYKLDPALQAAHAAHPWLLTWDDHEVENDYAGERSLRTHGPEAFLRLRTAAYKAYFEHMPVSPAMAPRGASMRIHERFRFGQLAELWTLDGRQYRSLQACAQDQVAGGRVLTWCEELSAPGRSLLGADQEAWLANGLAGSTRTWKLLGQGSQMSPWGVDTPMGRSVYSDAWDGYPAARERLLRGAADAGVRNLVSLGGDVHRHVAAELRLRPNDARSPVVATEFVTSSLTTRGLPETATDMIRAANPDLHHARGDERGYALIELTREAVRCEFRATAFPVQPDAPLHTQARFAVERDTTRLHRDG